MRRQILVAAALFCGVILMAAAARADGKLDLDKVPAKIMSAIKGRFPDAQLKSVEEENENGKVMYDVELTQKGRKYEMDINGDGTIVEVEKEVAAKDFPAACAKAVAAKFPNAKIKEIMEVNKVDGKKETPQNYEVTLEEPGKKAFEAIVALDGSSVKEEKE
ncbi:MAG TPA: PepSY-like domain-containing protein [Pirellulales bacterium]|nr:PepSY-like domain-containing protein [Pirellulales bacterium]